MKAWLYSIFILVTFLSWQRIDFLDDLQKKYNAYAIRYPQVNIHLTFNQPGYSPGDTAFFSAWYLNEAIQPVNGSHIITLDLISGEGKVVQKIRFKTVNGRAANQLIFEKTLPPGGYDIVCYTDWMKNFDNDWFYRKRINLQSEKEVILKSEVKNDQVTFYPEGGHCVSGIENRIIVRGKPLTELLIECRSSSEAIKVLLDSVGVGSFSVRPKIGEDYIAKSVQLSKTWILPQIEKDGIGLHVDYYSPGLVALNIPSDSKFRDERSYAVVYSKGKLLLKKELFFKDSSIVQLKIPIEEDVRAPYQVFVFDSKSHIVAERTFVPALYNDDIVVKIQLPSETKQRESISGTVKVEDKSGKSLKANFSTTIFQKKLFGNDWIHRYSNLLDFPELIAIVEGRSLAGASYINDFLITQKRGRINWENILTGKSPELRYAFQNQIKLMGEVLSKNTGKPSPDSTTVITYLQKNVIGYEGYTKNGKFEIPFIFDFWDEDWAFCTLMNKTKTIDSDYIIKLYNDTIRTDRWLSYENQKSSSYGEYAFRKDLITTSYAFFNGNQDKQLVRDSNSNRSFEDELSGADYSINVSDYIVFPKMEDLLHEIVPSVQYKKRRDLPMIRIFYRQEIGTITYKEDPLYIVDGIMTKNTDFFLSLKPENLISIKVINNPNKLTRFGRLGENGIILVESKKGDLLNASIQQSLFSVVGLSKSLDFSESHSSNRYDTLFNRVPDLRSTLYWNPLDKSDLEESKLAFPLSDDIGNFVIRVEGFTLDGRSFSSEQIINVNFNNNE